MTNNARPPGVTGGFRIRVAAILFQKSISQLQIIGDGFSEDVTCTPADDCRI